MPCAPDANSTSATVPSSDLDLLQAFVAAHDTLRHVVAHASPRRLVLAAHPPHQVDEVRAVADDRLGDRVLGLEIDPGGHLSQRKIRIEKLAVLLKAMDVENIPERSVLDPGPDLLQGGRIAEGEPDLGLDAGCGSGAG